MIPGTFPPDPPRVPDLGPGWTDILKTEFGRPYFAALKQFLVEERARHTVYPTGGDLLRAFQLTPFETVRVVILGQDPYHGPGQAHGLSFSVPAGLPPPPSLKNIIKEIRQDTGAPASGRGDLTPWAQQGVLLLNATLSVRAGEAASHQGRGWECFTDAAIRALSARGEGLVFLLWGRHAQAKEALIDRSRHHLLKAPHPSPLSAHRGFLGCGHFSATNRILRAQGGTPIDWST
ncbi:MAG: uracil-DNA glycosylase [Flavobacteriales bacterium]|nr:uracil-DNA glycosylase [Flavobacteriales bacterium]